MTLQNQKTTKPTLLFLEGTVLELPISAIILSARCQRVCDWIDFMTFPGSRITPSTAIRINQSERGILPNDQSEA